MQKFARIVVMWTGRHEAQLTIAGDGADPALAERLDAALERLVASGARHLVVDVHRLNGNDVEVLELLAATCHRLWRQQGTMDVHGVRHRLVSRPEVDAFPELFGAVDHATLDRLAAGSSPWRSRDAAP